MKSVQLLSAFALVGLAGCAGMVNKVDRDSIGGVKTVAIVGMTFDQQAPNSAQSVLDNLVGKAGVEVKASGHAERAYGLAKATLEAKKGWKIVDPSKVASHPEVVRMYERKNATVQTGISPLGRQFSRYEAPGVPQFYYLHWAEKTALNAIAKDLGVDALVLVQASTRLSQKSLLGIGFGSIGSVTDLALFVYDPKRSDFTVVMNVSGDEAKTTEGQFAGFADKDSMNIQALQAFQSALDKAVTEI